LFLGSSKSIGDTGPPGFERARIGAPHQPAAAGADVWLRRWNVPSLDRVASFASDHATGSWVAVSGNPLIAIDQADEAPSDSEAAWLLSALETRGMAALENVDGGFAIAWWHAPRHELRLIRDRFGIEPLFYTLRDGEIWFASRLRDLVASRAAEARVCDEGLAQFLVYCYVPGDRTLHRNVRRVPPGKLVVHRPSRPPQFERWYSLSFADPWPADEQEIADRYRAELERAVQRRLYGGNPGVLLSGGMDSSSVATFARRHWSGPIHSFGFRCGGASFDESYYARSLATELSTEHAEVDFDERDSLTIGDIIEQMEVPFCDVGIEVGTWLLGGIARGRTEFVLTGDGGDEMWASHPVYAAQKLLRWYDGLPIPEFVHAAIFRIASALPDSDKKRNLAVVIKRILPPPGVPRDLRHFRWRTYYAPQQLRKLSASPSLNAADPFACVLESFLGYRGPDDGISPLLYSDYTTASGFYFSRLLLCRHFGLEVRMPFYDRRFVEFGARIPARLKLEGIERTKRLFRAAMKGVVPDVITDRKDKLGNSVPLKNWLRNRSILDGEIAATLTKKKIEARGLFRFDAIERMLTEHRTKRHNHSHRIWALFVLERWLQRHLS
jgi:asparagine synthase (glutamine-hydrolysing)